LLGELTGLRIQFLLDIEARLKYRQDEPALEIKMTRKGGEVLSYHFSKPEDASYYALIRSDLDNYFKGFLKECPEHMKQLVEFALNTGCRSGEITALRWDWEVEVPELEISVFILPSHATKNGEES
jgi:hypothetical protein